MTSAQRVEEPVRRRIDEGEGSPGILRALAVAGIAGPIVFTVAFVVQGLLRVGEYSPVAETVSALEAGPNGWVQQVNFVVFGLLMIAFAIGLHRGVRPSRAGVAGPAIMVWTGVGLVLAAVFPLREDAAGLKTDPTGLHFVNGVAFFFSIGIGLIVLSHRLAHDPRWRSLASYTLATGITAVILFIGLPVLVAPDDAPLHLWAGLYQRAVLAVWFPCLIVLALRLRRIARSDRSTDEDPRRQGKAAERGTGERPAAPACRGVDGRAGGWGGPAAGPPARPGWLGRSLAAGRRRPGEDPPRHRTRPAGPRGLHGA